MLFFNIPDTLFKAYIVWRFDADGDGEINLTEASSVRIIEIKNESIKDVTGIEHFKNMTKLSLCSPATDNTNPYTGKIKKIDLSQNTKLTELIIEHQSLTELDVSQNRLLTYFGVYSTPLRHIDISMLKQVSLLGFGYCKLEEIDISNSPELTEVHLDNNVLKTVTLGNDPKLYYLDVSNNKLETIDISDCRALNILDCLNNPDLKSIYMAKGQVLGDLRKDDRVRIVYR